MDQKQNLILFLGELESKKLDDDTFDWLEMCCNKVDESILNKLILNLDVHFDDQQFVLNAFKGLIKIYEINPNIFTQQVKDVNLTSKILLQYLFQINYNKWSEIGLQLLELCFDENHFTHQIKLINNTQQLQVVNNILSYFGSGDNAEVFSILIQILFMFYENEDKVLFIIQHENARFFQEFLLEYLNHTQRDVSKALFLIETILKLDKDFFYVNDFKLLQQLSIRQIYDGTDYERRLYLRNLKIIIQNGNEDNILGNQILEAARMVQMTYTDDYCLKKCVSIIESLVKKQKQ